MRCVQALPTFEDVLKLKYRQDLAFAVTSRHLITELCMNEQALFIAALGLSACTGLSPRRQESLYKEEQRSLWESGAHTWWPYSHLRVISAFFVPYYGYASAAFPL